MKKTVLSLLICAIVSGSALAETVPQAMLAEEGMVYDSIVIKLKPSSETAAHPVINLSDPSLVATAMYPVDKSDEKAAAEMEALNKRYGFDRYLRITLPGNKTQDKNYINSIINELEHNQNIESVYPESLPVLLDDAQAEAAARPKLKSSVNNTLGAAAIPDYRHFQDYLKAPNERRTGYYMGGVNRDSVNLYKGSDGEGITIVSSENCAWNPNHLNLPPIAFSEGLTSDTCKEREHNTASVGILAGQDIGTGIRGLSWKSKLAYAGWPSSNLFNMIPKLKAGDVVSLNMQSYGGEAGGGVCKKDCFVPVENMQGYFDVIKALTDKGVFVVSSAGNGNINLDLPGFNGKWDTHVRDSGAIIVGAFCAKTGMKAGFSTYGKRVTSASWGCNDVFTTGYGSYNSTPNANYTNTFGGTSSSTPIVAGVVASLSGIAKAHGITVTPLQMRQILQETGTPAKSDTVPIIGTQPDMARAVAKILALKNGGETLPAPTAAAGADYSMESPTTGVKTYPLDGSKSLNAKSYNWSVTKGAGTFFVQQNLNGTLSSSVNSAHAYAVIPANTEGDAVFTLTTTGADGRTAQDSMTIKVSKPAVPAQDTTPAKDETPAQDTTPSKDETPAQDTTPAKDETPAQDTTPAKDETPAKETVPAYNPKIAYPVKCTKVSHNGKIWFNQWYVNPGQEEPGKGFSTWGAWREQGSKYNTCK
ncbi:S8 family serine peptidase [Leclercia sp. EC_58]|uniref:S8 family serine peptidase n=1 Tax=Leclercia sp. EC_58 TaxID=2584090 RepID=UPI001C6FE3FF|nr:S8 family serine peptidase [Leclercia sp. EC_58]MBW9398610.1 S8 family serine peptidase [Leclercia sp. EC_58]